MYPDRELWGLAHSRPCRGRHTHLGGPAVGQNNCGIIASGLSRSVLAGVASYTT